MKKLLTILLPLLLVAAFTAFTYQSKPQQWEYRTEVNPNDKKMTDLGAQGWELAAIEAKPMAMSGAIGYYVFKRPR